MNQISEYFRKALRPLYLPITNRLRAKLVTPHAFVRHPSMALPAPWDFMQFQVERRLHEYLHCSRLDIKNIIIVGANVGDEISVLSANYPEAAFVCYEPSPRYFPILKKRFGASTRVCCRQSACGEKRTTATLHELPMDGNGSLLVPDIEDWTLFNQWKGTQEQEEFQVNVTTLDEETPDLTIDLLWADVQGFEKQVLLGAASMLTRTKAVFLEVATASTPYEGGALFDDLNNILASKGLKLAGLGIDPWNFSGNALWIRNPESLACSQAPLG